MHARDVAPCTMPLARPRVIKMKFAFILARIVTESVAMPAVGNDAVNI